MKNYRDNDQTIQFLQGLNDNFGTLRSQMLLIEPLPTVNRVLFLALQHERQILNNPGLGIIATANGNSQSTAEHQVAAGHGNNSRRPWEAGH